jgi:alpha-galactosidase
MKPAGAPCAKVFQPWLWCVVVLVSCLNNGPSAAGTEPVGSADEFAERDRFVRAKLLGEEQAPFQEAKMEVLGPDAGIRFGSSGHSLRRNVNWDEQPLRIGSEVFDSGVFIHANSRVAVRLPRPGKRFSAVIGVDSNRPELGQGSLVAAVSIGGKRVYETPVLRSNGVGAAGRAKLDIELDGADEFVLEIEDAKDGVALDFAVVADARITLDDGNVMWLGTPVSGGFSGVPPFSFLYGGRPFAELMSSWPVERTAEQIDSHRRRQTVSYKDPKTGLEVRCVAVVYDDFPTVEWTVFVTNLGTSDTPTISDLQGIDVLLARGAAGKFVLNYQRGSTATPDECEPFEESLATGASKRLAPLEGRPSSEYLPYFNLEWDRAGAIFALGWPGQWAATFARADDRTLRVVAGQELTHFTLHPGETVRTPLNVLQFWRGHRTRAQNVWRRWMLAHNLPRPAGRLPSPMWSAHSGAQLAEMMMANEQNQIEFIDGYLNHGLKIDNWWMDYAWNYYQGNDIRYEADLNRFPRGLRAITDHARARGVKSIAWFEPEVCTTNYRVFREHPEWMLGQGHGLVNLGTPEAREWVTDQVYGQIVKEGLDIYRSDYNIGPLLLWRKADTAERQGITENRYITGYLAFWDELLRRKPDLLIDACSSGGRRNDLETMRRAVPLWRSDYNNVGYAVFNYAIVPRKELATSLQNHTFGLARWLPYFGTAARDADVYTFRSGMCPAILSCWDVRNDKLDFELLKRMTRDWRGVADYYLGDFYPLTDYSLSPEAWMAWQFDRPDMGGGIVQAFRREGSPMIQAEFPLHGLDPSADYRVMDLDDATVRNMTGQELIGGKLTVTIGDRPGSRLLKYERLTKDADARLEQSLNR